MNDTKNLSFEEFVESLEQEYKYHLDGGTKYRQLTVKYSLEVAKRVKNANSFLNQETAQQLVVRHLPSLDQDRLNDVSKMLRALAGRMHHEKNLSDELRDNRSKKRNNKLKFIF